MGSFARIESEEKVEFKQVVAGGEELTSKLYISQGFPTLQYSNVYHCLCVPKIVLLICFCL